MAETPLITIGERVTHCCVVTGARTTICMIRNMKNSVSCGQMYKTDTGHSELGFLGEWV